MQPQVILILIGWLTGVLSTVGYEQYKRYLDGKNLKSAILSELKVLLPRLVLIYYVLITESGKYDKENLQWVYDNLSSYEDKTIASKILSTKEKIEKMLKQIDKSANSTIELKTDKSEVEHIKSITLSSPSISFHSTETRSEIKVSTVFPT